MHRFALLALALALTACRSTPQPADQAGWEQPVATFSIVAYDPQTKELGIAVQSKFVAVGAVVPYAKAGVGAVATQAWANPRYGPEGLRLMAGGASAQEAIDKVTAADPQRARRQVGMVDAKGRPATYTGAGCFAWAGGKTGKHYCVQGNILAGQAVTDAMAKAYETAKGDLGTRLLAALAAGQEAGGDKRGRQSAALLIVREGWGYGGEQRYRDLRVDDHPTPIKELQRVYAVHQRVFPPRKR